jgi:hypothetical protein
MCMKSVYDRIQLNAYTSHRRVLSYFYTFIIPFSILIGVFNIIPFYINKISSAIISCARGNAIRKEVIIRRRWSHEKIRSTVETNRTLDICAMRKKAEGKRAWRIHRRMRPRRHKQENIRLSQRIRIRARRVRAAGISKSRRCTVELTAYNPRIGPGSSPASEEEPFPGSTNFAPDAPSALWHRRPRVFID